MTQPSEAHIAAMEEHYGVTYEGKTGFRGQDAWSSENYPSLEARSNGQRHFIPGFNAGLEAACRHIEFQYIASAMPDILVRDLNGVRALADQGVIK